MVEKDIKNPKKAVKKTAEEKTETKSDKIAVIKTGGKQYIVHEGLYFDVEKLDVEEGKELFFEDVLLLADNGNIKIGQPKVEGSKVTAKVLKQFKDKKVKVLKYKPRKRQKKTYGHRQSLTKVQITKIV